jgi:hypothetical protein
MEDQKYIESEDGKTVVLCEKCGGTYVEGAFPFCKGVPENHGEMHGFDEAFEPYVDTQLLPATDPRCTGVNERGARGVPIGSRSERRAYMKELGLQYGTQKWVDRGKTLYFDQKR